MPRDSIADKEQSTVKPTSTPDPLVLDTGLLGGSWVVISRVLSRVTILITHVRDVQPYL